MFKKHAKILAAVLALAMLAGCGGGGANNGGAATGGEAKDSGKQATIKFMTWEGEAMNKAMVDTMGKFMTDNPNIKVELEPSPLTDYGIKLQEMLASGTAPDIFMVGNDMALNYDANNLVVDLKPYMDKNQEFYNGFYPGVMTTYTNNGKLVGMPGLVNMYGIFYNKKFFTDAGVKEPTKDWTFDDLYAAAEALKDPASQRFGLYSMALDVYGLSIYSASKDGTGFCDAIFPVSKVQASPAFKEGVDKAIAAVKSGAVMPPTFTVDNITGMFMQGAIPMMRYGQWAADELIRNAPADLQWGYAPSPRVDKNAQIIDAVGWCLNKASKSPDEAFKVMMYLETDTYGAVLSQTPVAPPAHTAGAKAYYQTLTDKGHKDMADGLDYMLTAEIKLPVRFLDPWGAKAAKFLDAEWNNIINGVTPTSEIDTIVNEINEVIAAK